MRDVIVYDLPGYGITEEVKGYWCYAAVEQALRLALLSDPIEQAEIVHRSFINQAAIELGTSGDKLKQTNYHKLVAAQKLGVEEVESYDDIFQIYTLDELPFSEVRLNNEMSDLLRGNTYGQIQWSAFPNANIDVADFWAVAAAIDASKLVVCGDQFHWRVIYGYRDPENTQAQADEYIYFVWDPANGQGKSVAYHTVLSQVALAVG